jgi:Spo0E like sporulation regulatory protein
MELRKYLYEYNQIKYEMEMSEAKFGLTDRRTIELSQKLDSLVNEITRIKYPGHNKKERLA